MKKRGLFIVIGALFITVSGYGQKTDTIPNAYKNHPVIVHYDDNNQFRFYSYTYFMKDSTWERTYFYKGEIKSRKKRGVETLDTSYFSNVFLEKTESYYPDGSLKSIWFNKPAFPIWSMDSSYVYYYPNGQVSTSSFYVKNREVGDSKHFYDNGQLAYVLEYKEGKLFNVKEYLDRKGEKLEVGTFKNGSGEWLRYDADGNIRKIDTYKKGKIRKSKKLRRSSK